VISVAARHLSQEAHLWYTITSPDYIAASKDKLQVAFDFLHERVLKHPFISGYSPVPHWGGVMEDLLGRFDNALALLKQGEFGPMQDWASRLSDIPRGFDESNMEWLSQPDQVQFKAMLDETYGICSDFLISMAMSQRYSDPDYVGGSGEWGQDIPEDVGIAGSNIALNYEEAIFPVLPDQIPEYAADTSVSCKTGDIVPWTGVWVPSTGMGTAALAFARQGVQIMQPAYEIASVDEDGYASFNLMDCIWHPVKPTGRVVEHPLLATLRHEATGARGRCEAGHRCPREGWWFTPAAQDSRRVFKLGEVMPSVKADYGQTIWQWDASQ
jgi:hypothetical protein